MIIFTLVFSAAFPPMIGYSTFLTLSGFTFGFLKGFLIAYFAALSGGIICFTLSRLWLKRYVKAVIKRYRHLGAALVAVEEKGFRLLVLIRIAPYPYSVLNVLLSATRITLPVFTLATALALFKIMLHVWIGSKLTSFTDSVSKRPSNLQIAVALSGGMLGVGLLLYIWLLAKRSIEEVAREVMPPAAVTDPLLGNVGEDEEVVV
ncbi:uncharacterized protein VTP21DRAFT_3811 [Calcarisporiella thermophila]|uniref:uncharacterized protein n=1 Tax=Calcarisporiella thermophila TaxID=911321 RepID=UPI00374337B6